MSLSITYTPEKIIQQDIPETSKWSAVWHPAIWKFLRQDLTVSDIADGGGSPSSVEIKGLGDFTSELAIGQTIYVNSDNGNQEGMFTILSFSFDGTKTVIEYDGVPALSMNATGYVNFISARSFYLVEVAVYNYVSGVPVLLTTEYGQFRPDTKGNIKIDLQTWLQSLLNPHSVFDYNSRTAPAEHLGHQYDIQIREYWKELGYGDFKKDTDLTGGDLSSHYITESVKQIGDIYGQNMGEFVMFPPDLGSPAYEHNKGKFLSKFPTPTYFVGYPFDISFIYDKSITDESLRLSIVEDLKDINEVSQTVTDDLIDDNNGVINRATLNAVINGAYASNIKMLDFYLNAKQTTGLVDPEIIWSNVAATLGGNNGDMIIVDNANSKILGFTNWQGSLNATLTALATSVNTNTPNGNPALSTFSPQNGYAFDNTAGFVLSWTSTFSFGINVRLFAPTGSGATFNWNTYSFLIDANTYVTNPSSTQTMSGGVDGTISDAVGLTTARVSEIKTIKVNDTCYDSPVYLRWLNPDGGYEYWLFSRNQIPTDIISNEQIYEKYIENLEDTDSRIVTMNKDIEQEVLLVTELLDIDDMIGLRYLLSSVDVSMLVIADSPIQKLSGQQTNFTWKNVRVKGGNFDLFQTLETKTRIELTMILPQRYNQKQ